MEAQMLDDLTEAARRAFSDARVEFAYVFGSRATGRARPDSDVDVAVQLSRDVDPSEYLSLRLRLASRLSDVGVPHVEVVVLAELPLVVLGRVLRDRLVIYSRDESARVEFESVKMRQFLDFEIDARILDLELLRRTADGSR